MEPGSIGLFTQMINWFGDIPAWITAVTTVVTAAPAIPALTPSKIDDRIIGKVIWFLNIIAGNIMKNKNKDAD